MYKRRILNLLLLALILQAMVVSASGASSVNEEMTRTSWYELPLAGLYGKPYQGGHGGKIRDLFKNPDEVINRDIIDKKSPALELVFGETGDKTYLDKKIPSCNAVQDGPKLFFPHCSGEVVVVTIAGAMKMTCNEIERRVFYGPVTIKSGKCQQSFNFEMGCDKKKALSITSNSCSDSEYKSAFVTMSTLFSLAIMVLVLLTVWYIGMRKGVVIGGKRAQLIRESCYYAVHYNEFTNGNGKKEYLLENESSVVNMERRVLRKHWAVLLIMFLLCRPIADCCQS